MYERMNVLPEFWRRKRQLVLWARHGSIWMYEWMLRHQLERPAQEPRAQWLWLYKHSVGLEDGNIRSMKCQVWLCALPLHPWPQVRRGGWGVAGSGRGKAVKEMTVPWLPHSNAPFLRFAGKYACQSCALKSPQTTKRWLELSPATQLTCWSCKKITWKLNATHIVGGLLFGAIEAIYMPYYDRTTTGAADGTSKHDVTAAQERARIQQDKGSKCVYADFTRYF